MMQQPQQRGRRHRPVGRRAHTRPAAQSLDTLEERRAAMDALAQSFTARADEIDERMRGFAQTIADTVNDTERRLLDARAPDRGQSLVQLGDRRTSRSHLDATSSASAIPRRGRDREGLRHAAPDAGDDDPRNAAGPRRGDPPLQRDRRRHARDRQGSRHRARSDPLRAGPRRHGAARGDPHQRRRDAPRRRRADRSAQRAQRHRPRPVGDARPQRAPRCARARKRRAREPRPEPAAPRAAPGAAPPRAPRPAPLPAPRRRAGDRRRGRRAAASRSPLRSPKRRAARAARPKRPMAAGCATCCAMPTRPAARRSRSRTSPP